MNVLSGSGGTNLSVLRAEALGRLLRALTRLLVSSLSFLRRLLYSYQQ